MKMHLDRTAGVHRITGYGDGFVVVDEQRLTRSFVLGPAALITEWSPGSVAELDPDAMGVIIELAPALVLLGTGRAQNFPPAALLAPMMSRGIGVEIMTTAAACRTYNILVAEGREVAAGMLLP